MSYNSHSRQKSKVKPIIYGLLSFMLAFVLFLLSVFMVLETTVFSQDYMLSKMAETGYYSMLEDELKTELKSLGNASGLDESFAEDFVNSLDITEIEKQYISAFYCGDKTLVNTTEFKQQLYAALDKYMDDNGIDKSKTSQENLDYFVEQACERYVTQVSIPFFSFVANYIYNASKPVVIITISLAAAALIISAIIAFTNKFKHRRYRYLCYGCAGAFISVTLVPTVVLLSGKISQININTRSLYNLFVGYANGIFMYFFIYSAILLVLSFVTFVLYRRHYYKAINHS
ncbi:MULTISPECIES: hypothetical protein [unclassified Ruminococcus]|uniref:hypothetical protein n=1 Tax=unclassified Ruminococcus TaxID=2608920 RepID=UPI00210EE01A|nr:MULTISPECIES: hypothetical protein [unclassified Ruminococcus]MCQ4022761.1 hypothetical protein [Ruminococcus sp. zg-924]MCQ4115001.1 hypothetical protein [Ruminococcus sp. zg-921]